SRSRRPAPVYPRSAAQRGVRRPFPGAAQSHESSLILDWKSVQAPAAQDEPYSSHCVCLGIANDLAYLDGCLVSEGLSVPAEDVHLRLDPPHVGLKSPMRKKLAAAHLVCQTQQLVTSRTLKFG